MSLSFACSNIAWSADEEDSALACLRAHGVTGLEIAPTRLWPDWIGATPAAARVAAAEYAARGFAMAAMQALLFGKPEAQLFGDDNGKAFETHLIDVARIGGALGAKAAVLGAPRNRQRHGLPVDQALARAVPLLRRLARIYAEEGLVLALEPARPEYGGDFITTTLDALACVQAVDHPGLGLHLDAAALLSAGEPIEAVWAAAESRRPVHYQLSEPDLAGFTKPQAPHLHNLRFLRDHEYSGWCSIEMRALPGGLEAHGPWDLLSQAGP